MVYTFLISKKTNFLFIKFLLNLIICKLKLWQFAQHYEYFVTYTCVRLCVTNSFSYQMHIDKLIFIFIRFLLIHLFAFLNLCFINKIKFIASHAQLDFDIYIRLWHICVCISKRLYRIHCWDVQAGIFDSSH